MLPLTVGSSCSTMGSPALQKKDHLSLLGVPLRTLRIARLGLDIELSRGGSLRLLECVNAFGTLSQRTIPAFCSSP
jgi:hypothetical protein